MTAGPAAARAGGEGWTAAGALAGVAAPLVYGVAVVAGGWLTPGYSAAANMISELTMTGAPGRAPLAALFVLYNLLVAAFALALPRLLAGGSPMWVNAAAVLLIVTAAAGIGMVTLFPTDRPTDPLTAKGWVHVVLASLGTMAAVFAVGWGLWHTPRWRGIAVFSFFCLAAIAASGVWTATAAAHLSPVMGIAERTTIGAYMAWLFVLALAAARRRRTLSG